MNHFKDENDNIFAFEEDGSQDHLILDSYTAINDAELSELIASKEPPKSALQIRNESLSNITYTRPSDGVEIQIRDSQFFPQDEARMTKAINRLQPLETAPWISKDNQAITVTREDLVAALDYQADEIESIFTDYIATL